MSQNKEATQFLSRIANLAKGPVSLDAVLQPSLDDEAELRKLFATDKSHARLKDIHVGLVNVFAAPPDIRTTRARVITDDADRDAQYVMSLPDALRRKEGSPAMVEGVEAFKKNWSIFTENSLSQLSDWSNVVAAGGSVQACLIPLPKAATASKRAMRKHYHEKAFPSSDVDLFLYGLTPQEAESKIITIYEAVRDSVPWDVICVRTKHTVSIHSQYPYRSIQIVLRLYSSPAEILAGFDVDAPCCAYDGNRVWANPRAIVSMMRQSNTVDMTRRSPSYEVRLAKYSSRGFEIYIPGLKRGEIDPTIYERSVGRVQGLARLFAIEKLATPESRSQYQQRRNVLRGRPAQNSGFMSYNRRGRRYVGDLKADTVFSGLELSDYDIVNLHIPYGPGWDARRIEKLVYKTDFGANSPYNPKNKNRRLHRHSAFFGTMKECLEDCCELCPEPRNAEEHELQDEEDKSYVRGRIAFIEQDPGRQSISGSFNPIDEGEWSESAYIQATAKFFSAISKNDTVTTTQMIEDGLDVNRRDHVGRTPLHVAILSNSAECANALIDAGARMTARLVGGRTSLHVAAQMGQTNVVRKMLARSAYNAEKSAEEKRRAEASASAEDPEGAERVRMSSEDDWSSEESVDVKASGKAPTKSDGDKDDVTLEDDKEEPDVLDVSIPDWDFGLTALGYAILFGFVEVVDALLAAGANPNLATRVKGTNPLHPLDLTIYTQSEDFAAKIAERLIAAQALSSTADEKRFTIFHRLIVARKTKIVASLLRCDQNARKVLDIPARSGYGFVFPLVSSILSGDYATLSVLLAHGAKLVFSPEDASRAEGMLQFSLGGCIHSPIGVALVQRDEVVSLLAALGAAVDAPINSSYQLGMNLLQWVSAAVADLSATPQSRERESSRTQEVPTSLADTWAQYRKYLTAALPIKEDVDSVYAQGPVYTQGTLRTRNDLAAHLNEEYAWETRDYYARAESTLRSYCVVPFQSSEAPTAQIFPEQQQLTPQLSGYIRHVNYTTAPVPIHLKVLYDELYEACWTGDNALIQELCLPKHLSEGKEPIQISVHATLSGSLAGSNGWTPFLVALHRRHWETARLVIAIATAQYQPPDAEGMSFVPSSGVLSGYDSDEGSYDSDEDEDEYIEEQEINFTDLAARPSAVRTDVPASTMLRLDQGVLLEANGRRVFCNPLQKAVREDDLEAFVRTLELYQFAGVALWPDAGVHWLAVALDRPDMVDELTRRTGVGIPYYPSDNAENPHQKTLKKAKEGERIYLGLKVGGKRRTEATQQAPRVLTYNFDLLRNAITHGSSKVIEYLAGPRPLAAYTYYAATHSDDIAQYVKSVEDLEAVLPDLLGWHIDELNESPLLCAVISNKLDILKQLFALKPKLMKGALQKRTRFVGFNALLAAAYYCSSTEIVDYLLEMGCDPSERDTRCWNIYHLACLSENTKRVKLVKHLLKVLPKELSHELMAQTSKENSNTPLMVAVKRGYTETTRAILEFGVSPAVFLIKDADGSTPLHITVQNNNTALAEILIQYGPVEQHYIENSVGQTPLEIAGLKFLPRVTGSKEAPRPTEPQANVASQVYNFKRTAPFDVEKQKVEIPKLRTTLNMLVTDSRLVPGTKLATELFAFADRMEEKLAIETARKKDVEKDVKEDGKVDPPVALGGTTAGTYVVLRDAVAARPGPRHLVHLVDVHRSVQRSLAQEAKTTISSRIQQMWESEEEKPKQTDPEWQRIAQLKQRSLFSGTASAPYQPVFGLNRQIVNLFCDEPTLGQAPVLQWPGRQCVPLGGTNPALEWATPFLLTP